VSPDHGSLSVPAHAVKRALTFTLPHTKVTFHEFDLAPGTRWEVNLTGPENLSVLSKTAVVSVLLENGTYGYSVSNFTTLHPHPASGSISVIAPGPPITVTITYTSEAGNGTGAPRSGAAPIPLVPSGALPAGDGVTAARPPGG